MKESQKKSSTLWTRSFALVCTSSFALFISFYYLLPTLPMYAKMWGWRSDQIGLIVGVFALSSLALRPILGHLVDTSGRKWLVVLGTVMFFLSSSLYNFAHTLTALIAIRILHGAGMGVYDTSATTLAADCAPDGRRGEAMGIYGAFINLAMAVGPAVGGFMIASVKDPSLGPIPQYRAAFTGLFILSAASALVAVMLSLPIKDVLPASHKVGASRMVLFNPEAVFPGFVILTVTATYGTLISFLPDLAHTRHLGQPGIFFTIYALVLMAVRVAAGRISDKKGRGTVIIPGMLFIATAMALLAFSKSAVHMYAAAVLYAVGMASTQPALMALAVDRVDISRRGAAMGTFTAAFELGLGGGAILFGMLLSATNYTATFLATSAVAMLGFTVFCAGMVRDRGKVKE